MVMVSAHSSVSYSSPGFHDVAIVTDFFVRPMKMPAEKWAFSLDLGPRVSSRFPHPQPC